MEVQQGFQCCRPGPKHRARRKIQAPVQRYLYAHSAGCFFCAFEIPPPPKERTNWFKMLCRNHSQFRINMKAFKNALYNLFRTEQDLQQERAPFAERLMMRRYFSVN